MGVQRSVFLMNHEQSIQHTPMPNQGTNITRRDYFAAQALQAILSLDVNKSYQCQPNERFFADFAVRYADALIKSLEASER